MLRVRDEPRKPRSHTDCVEEDWAPGTHLADDHFRITHNVVTQRTRSCVSGRRVGRVWLAGDLAFVRGRFEQCLRSLLEPPSPLLMRLASEQLVACAHQRKTLITEVGGMKKSPTPLRRTMSPGCAHGIRVKKCHPRKKPLPHPCRKGPSLLSNSEHTVSVWRSGIVYGRPSALLLM